MLRCRVPIAYMPHAKAFGNNILHCNACNDDTMYVFMAHMYVHCTNYCYACIVMNFIY